MSAPTNYPKCPAFGSAKMARQVPLIRLRKAYATKRLDKLRAQIANLQSPRKFSDLCIYVTGSYGRLEASRYSDLDIFLVSKGNLGENPVSAIDKTLLDADLIRVARRMRFPEFSNEGEYLTVHYLDDLTSRLGGRDDDFRNHFTARLLLLLESRPLHNESVYRSVLEAIVESYFRDFHDHETSFRPVFLINDVMRFWRTLCLNYEHRRNRPKKDPVHKNKSHLKNAKLKFSRLLTCYSLIALLSHRRDATVPEELLEMVQLAPLDRLDRLASLQPHTQEDVLAMKEAYSFFLERTGREPDLVLDWIADPCHRNEIFGLGKRFATNMHRVLCKVTDQETMRFLVV